MKIKKLFDGVYELNQWEHGKLTSESANDARARFEALAAEFGTVVRSNHTVIECDDPNATPGTVWHIDDDLNGGLIAHGINYMLVMVACDDPRLGTEIQQGGLKLKTWTPYLVRWDVVHRGPQQATYRISRLLLRCGLALNEAKLDASASTVYKVAA